MTRRKAPTKRKTTRRATAPARNTRRFALDRARAGIGKTTKRGAIIAAAVGGVVAALGWQTGGSDVLQLVKVGVIVLLAFSVAVATFAWRDGFSRGLLSGMGAEVKRRRNTQARSRARAQGVPARPRARVAGTPVPVREVVGRVYQGTPTRSATTPSKAYPLPGRR